MTNRRAEQPADGRPVKKRGQNEGSIYQRANGRWVGAVTLEDGKRKSFYGRTRNEVARKVNRALHDLEQGITPADDRLTVEQFLNRWLEQTAKPAVRYSTLRGYEQVVRCHLIPELGKIRLSKLSADDVEAFCNRTLAKGRVTREKKSTADETPDKKSTADEKSADEKPQEPEPDLSLSPRTVQYCHAVLRMALKSAVRKGTIPRNVASLVDAPKVTREPVVPLTIDEAKALLKAASGDPLEALYVVTLALGLRRGEVCGLKWEDIDLTERRLWIRRALQHQKDKGLVEVEPKSRTSRRALPMPPVVAQALTDHRRRQNTQRLSMGPKWKAGDWVFTMEDGRPVSPDYVNKVFPKLLTTAKLRHVRFHDLRHSCASLLFAQGCEMRLVMEILGHSQISLTANTYTHLLPEGDRAAADAMQAVLG